MHSTHTCLVRQIHVPIYIFHSFSLSLSLKREAYVTEMLYYCNWKHFFVQDFTDNFALNSHLIFITNIKYKLKYTYIQTYATDVYVLDIISTLVHTNGIVSSRIYIYIYIYIY